MQLMILYSTRNCLFDEQNSNHKEAKSERLDQILKTMHFFIILNINKLPFVKIFLGN